MGFPPVCIAGACGLKRFIELIWERDKEDIFRGKYTALIAASIHFYDNTAINYMHAVCDDLDMQYTGYYSANMQDLMDVKLRGELLVFARNFFDSMASKVKMIKGYAP